LGYTEGGQVSTSVVDSNLIALGNLQMILSNLRMWCRPYRRELNLVNILVRLHESASICAPFVIDVEYERAGDFSLKR
jgi:hypothetical protein